MVWRPAPRSVILAVPVAVLLGLAQPLIAAAECPGPAGIYVLDSDRGTYRDGNIRDYSFVAGYTWRWSWRNFEPQPDVYDFTPLDHIIERVSALGLKIALANGTDGEPDYLLTTPGVTTYEYVDSKTGLLVRRPVPWDPYVLERFRAFVRALAEHPVPDPAAGGTPVPLRAHSAVASINRGIPGLGSIRDREIRIADMPGYTRTRFFGAVSASLNAVTAQFPDKHVHIGFWKVLDGKSPALWKALLRALLNEFDGVDKPRVGFFQDNLAASKDPDTGVVTGYPSPTYAAPLYQAQDLTFTVFEALQSWKRPFREKAKVANAVPADGLKYAYDTFGTTQVSVYVPDADEPSYWPSFTAWSEFLSTLPASCR